MAGNPAEIINRMRLTDGIGTNVTFTANPNRIVADVEYGLARVVLDATFGASLYSFDHPDQPASIVDNSTLVRTKYAFDLLDTFAWAANINYAASGLWARANGTGATIQFITRLYCAYEGARRLLEASLVRVEGADTLESSPVVSTDLGSIIHQSADLTLYNEREGTTRGTMEVVLGLLSDTNIVAGDIDLPVYFGYKGRSIT